jgi:hypothetical protein
MLETGCHLSQIRFLENEDRRSGSPETTAVNQPTYLPTYWYVQHGPYCLYEYSYCVRVRASDRGFTHYQYRTWLVRTSTRVPTSPARVVF